MKTKIHFSVDSEEITKQITAVITAEAKNIARNIAKEQFEIALNEKITSIIKGIDDCANRTELRRFIAATIMDAVREVFTKQENTEIINKLAQKNYEIYIQGLSRATDNAIKQLSCDVVRLVAEEVKAYMSNIVVQAAIGGNSNA